MEKEKMTLRDQLAIAALHGLMTRHSVLNYTEEQFAAQAYRLADAMLLARATPDPPA